MKHKHAELIKAWADGAEIEYLTAYGNWVCKEHTTWHEHNEYRIKPEPKTDEVRFYRLWHEGAYWSDENMANVKVTFDGETGKLKSVEVLK
jgi:hypothetical protein